MSSYGFIKELIEKEHTPTPAYVFDLDKMKEFVKKVQSCRTLSNHYNKPGRNSEA